MFSLCNFGSPYSRGDVASEAFNLTLASFVIFLVSSKLLTNLLTSLLLLCKCGWVRIKMVVSFLIIQHFLCLVITLCLRLEWCYLCQPWWLLYLDISLTAAILCVFSSKLIYFGFCFVWLKPLCHELSHHCWEKCLVIRLQLSQGYLWYTFRGNSKIFE